MHHSPDFHLYNQHWTLCRPPQHLPGEREEPTNDENELGNLSMCHLTNAKAKSIGVSNSLVTPSWCPSGFLGSYQNFTSSNESTAVHKFYKIYVQNH